MKIVPNKDLVAKNSSDKSSNAKVLQALQKVATLGGTITYFFLEDRIRFTEEHPEGEAYQRKTSLHADINQEVFYTLDHGKKRKRTPAEVLQVFEDTCWDKGAAYYLIG